MYCKALGQDKEEEPYEVPTIAGVRLPSQYRAFTGYAELQGLKKGMREYILTLFNSTAQRPYRETNCTCIKEIVATTKIQVSNVRERSTSQAYREGFLNLGFQHLSRSSGAAYVFC